MTTRAEIRNSTYELVPCSRLREHPRNARKGNTEEIAKSIEQNGFFGACVVQTSTGNVLVGNHRFRAAKQLGLPSVPVLWVDVSDEQALRILTADNQTSNLGADDPATLLANLQTIQQEFGSIEGTGYDPGKIDSLLAELTPKHVEEFGFLGSVGDSQSGDEDDSDLGDGLEFDQSNDSNTGDQPIPLAIVLQPADYARWRELRVRFECSNDTDMILTLMEKA